MPKVECSVTDVDGDGVGPYLLLILVRQRDICIEEQRFDLGLCMLAYVGEFILLYFLKAKWHYFSVTINETMGLNENENL